MTNDDLLHVSYALYRLQKVFLYFSQYQQNYQRKLNNFKGPSYDNKAFDENRLDIPGSIHEDSDKLDGHLETSCL